MSARKSLFRLYGEVPARAYLVASAALPATLGTLWVVLTYGGWVDPIFLPTPNAILEAAWTSLRDGVLQEDVLTSSYRILVGWLVATALALPLGVLMGTLRLFEALLEPLISPGRYIPIVALIPLSILWTGVGDVQKFTMIFLGTFFPEVLMVADNVKAVPQDIVRVARTFGLGTRELLRDVIVPYALPQIFDTLRTTLGWAWTYLVVAELVAANSGLGFRIMQAQRYLATDRILLGVTVIGLLGFLTDFAFKAAYRRLFPWVVARR
jgi:NitT/TauT family transport system permease protein